MLQTTARNATLEDMVRLLRDQHGRKIDIVAPASKIRSVEGQIQISGMEPVIDDHGVTDANGLYLPTAVFDEGVSEKMKIPLAYVRRLRESRPDLYDANVNGWLAGRKPKGRMVPVEGGGSLWHETSPGIDPDPRSFMLRMFRGDEPGEPGVARALLSDRFGVIDNLDVLTAALSGVEDAGIPVDIAQCDLTDRRMYVKVKAPQISAVATTLLEGYRSPFNGRTGADNPEVFAGFRISNSETGDGSFSITPEITVKVCDNGMTMTKDALRRTHLGSRMEESVVRWSHDTVSKNLDLVKAQTRDAVNTFLDVEYVKKKIREVEQKAGVPLAKPDESIRVLGKRLQFSESVIDGVLDHFIKGGQVTAGGFMQAITSFAQVVDDADVAADMQDKAITALELAAAL